VVVPLILEAFSTNRDYDRLPARFDFAVLVDGAHALSSMRYSVRQPGK
jgi:hypothetical protein